MAKTNSCLKVLISGVCPAPENERDRMHVCTRPEHAAELYHSCACGKSWDSPPLTDSQYAVAAYIKAVE